LVTFKQRFTTQGLIQLFVYCAFPVHVWALINMFRDVPSWVLYMPSGDVIGSVAYTLSFALIESLIILLVVLFVGMIVPKRWVLEKYIPMASSWLVELSVMAIVFQYFIIHHLPKRNLVIGFALILAVSTFLILRFPKVGDALRWIGERHVVLSLIYLFFDLFGLLVVVFRNV